MKETKSIFIATCFLKWNTGFCFITNKRVDYTYISKEKWVAGSSTQWCIISGYPKLQKNWELLSKTGHLVSLLDKGRQILMKDDLIDEEKARQEEAAQELLEQKIDRSNFFQIIFFWI